ncbi:unnamed protein product [Mesocestoides corti]|uniref:Vacuolar protein sorting-associated protein 54 n=1 Tax=Mesocestoides corti TaxID=53468 RepID=A0A0R3U8J9_MESCO|nr:unnamed protein product [Mesocestoides corti]
MVPSATTHSLAPTTKSAANSMGQSQMSVYANCYENYPCGSGSTQDGLSASPTSLRIPYPMSPPISPAAFETPTKTVSGAPSSNRALDLNNKNDQDITVSDNIPKRSFRKPGQNFAPQTDKPSVRFVEPPVSSAPDGNCRVPNSTSTTLPTSNAAADVKTSGTAASLPFHKESHPFPTSPHTFLPPENRISAMPPANVTPLALPPPQSLGLLRTRSAPMTDLQSIPARSVWQQTHSRIDLLVNEALALIDLLGRGGSAQVLIMKIRNIEQGLLMELAQLERLMESISILDSSVVSLLQDERQKLVKERDGRLVETFQRLKEPHPEKALRDLVSSLEQVSQLTQSIIGIVQLNWFDFNEEGGSRRFPQIEDHFSALSVSDRDESVATSLDSTEPTDLLGLLHVYAAQFHSHSLLVRGTADEFLGCIQAKFNEPRYTRGYHLPTAGVLVANAKFLLRCSSQLVALAANLSAALQNPSQSTTTLPQAEIDKLRSDLEAAGNSICESLKGLIAQTKEVAGYLSSPGLDLPATATTLASKPVVSGPEIERLVGAIHDVVVSSDNLRHLLPNFLAMKSSPIG